jgi:hypothetical protein
MNAPLQGKNDEGDEEGEREEAELLSRADTAAAVAVAVAVAVSVSVSVSVAVSVAVAVAVAAVFSLVFPPIEAATPFRNSSASLPGSEGEGEPWRTPSLLSRPSSLPKPPPPLPLTPASYFFLGTLEEKRHRDSLVSL